MNPLGILIGLVGAAAYGSGDFTGGLATRRLSQYQTLVLASASGLVVLIALVLFWEQRWPTTADVIWAALSGLGGVVGLTTLYRGLSEGYTATVAPVSGVISAIVPVAVGIATEGLPDSLHLFGFALAGVGIWLAASSHGLGRLSQRGLLYGLITGAGFGVFFVCIARAEEAGLVFAPLVASRSIMLLASLAMVWRQGQDVPAPGGHPFALLSGLLDVFGNVCFVLSKQTLPLAVASILAALYPAATIVLARIFVNERITRLQWVGGGFCVLAAVLLSV
jgi:drug/metabolite transporter (DMT)-like permease